MAGGVDLGKQVGPLPLGAWVAVVAGGLGIALYTRHQNSAPAQTEIVDDTSGDAGVGTGAVGGFVPTSPAPQNGVAVAPTTNDEWAVMVENGMIAHNYPPATVDSMVRKYIAGQTSTMSPTEFAMLSVALATYGGPPQTLPPDNEPGTPPGTTPPVGGGGTPAGPPALKFVVEIHQIARAESARSLIQRFSSPGASATQIEVALRRTMADPRNARYLPSYVGRGMFPAQAKVYTTVVK